MNVWERLRQKATQTIEDVQRDPRFRQSLQDAERIMKEVEREVELIRRQLRESATPVVDDTAELKQKLDAFRAGIRKNEE